jgi:hypothetical protein
MNTQPNRNKIPKALTHRTYPLQGVTLGFSLRFLKKNICILRVKKKVFNFLFICLTSDNVGLETFSCGMPSGNLAYLSCPKTIYY